MLFCFELCAALVELQTGSDKQGRLWVSVSNLVMYPSRYILPGLITSINVRGGGKPECKFPSCIPVKQMIVSCYFVTHWYMLPPP